MYCIWSSAHHCVCFSLETTTQTRDAVTSGLGTTSGLTSIINHKINSTVLFYTVKTFFYSEVLKRLMIDHKLLKLLYL